jgi:hypothetical protein
VRLLKMVGSPSHLDMHVATPKGVAAKSFQHVRLVVGCRPDEVKCDMLVEVTWEDITQEFSLPKFRPRR